jgi:hypothetical protein
LKLTIKKKLPQYHRKTLNNLMEPTPTTRDADLNQLHNFESLIELPPALCVLMNCHATQTEYDNKHQDSESTQQAKRKRKPYRRYTAKHRNMLMEKMQQRITTSQPKDSPPN